MKKSHSSSTLSVPDFDKIFDYENAFYATASIDRISKFATHLELYNRIKELPGDVIDCGVFKGNSLFRFIKFRELLENSLNRKIIAFDTFGDFPETNSKDDAPIRKQFIDAAGDQSRSKSEIITILKKLGLYKNVELIEGDIIETVPEYLSNNPQGKLSLLNIDVDLYEPTRSCLEGLFPRLVRGGIVILDDYGVFPGANKAIDDYFNSSELRVQKLSYSKICFIEKS